MDDTSFNEQLLELSDILNNILDDFLIKVSRNANAQKQVVNDFKQRLEELEVQEMKKRVQNKTSL